MFREQTFPVSGFLGLDESLVPQSNPRYTRSLDNVRVRDGRVIGRLGTPKYRGITTVSSTTPVLGLMAYIGSDLTNSVLRITPTAVHKLNTGTDVWDDVTGTALNGASTDLPQWDMHKGVLVFTNDGKDRPRKYTNSGNTAVLGGTPPFCKVLVSYLDYLLLFNTSAAGSTFLPRSGSYSNDYDANWTLCAGNELAFNETAGEIVAAKVVGRVVIVGKSDCLIWLRSIGGATRFSQDKLKFDQGVAAPLSFQSVGEFGVCFLGTDLQLHITDGQTVTTLPPRVQRKLQSTLDIANVRICSAASFPDKDIYYLLYPRSTSDTYSRGLIGYNFRTGEMFHDTFDGHQFLRLLAFRLARTSANLLIASTNDLVYQLEGADDDDDGTPVNRFYTTDWQHLGTPGYKQLTGVNVVFRRRAGVRAKIEVAKDGNEQWLHGKVFDLKGQGTNEDITVVYRLPTPLLGQTFNCRVKFYHDGTTNAGELHSLFFKFIPTEQGEARPSTQEQLWQ